MKNILMIDHAILFMISVCSKTTAAYGGPQTLPQISFKSTTTDLSDKDEYPYFARTCASDSAQGPSLSSLLMDIGVAPYIAMVSTTDDYAVSMSKSFSTRCAILSVVCLS